MPRSQLDWDGRTDLDGCKTRAERLSREEAQQYAKRIADSIQVARQNLHQAQKRQTKQANKKRREPDFTVGDKVWVDMRGLASTRPSQALDWKRRGPWTIMEKVGHSYRLDLPSSWHTHPILHAERLRRYPDNPMPGQDEDPPPPEVINGANEYEVHKVKESRYNKRDRTLQYRVDWVGHDPDDQWYPAENFKNAPIRLREFHNEYPEAPGPPKRLQVWIDAAAADEDTPEHPDDNQPVKLGRGHKKARRQRRIFVIWNTSGR